MFGCKECEKADADGYHLVNDLHEFGYPSFLFGHRKREVPDVTFERSKFLKLQDWFDPLIERCMTVIMCITTIYISWYIKC